MFYKDGAGFVVFVFVQEERWSKVSIQSTDSLPLVNQMRGRSGKVGLFNPHPPAGWQTTPLKVEKVFSTCLGFQLKF